MLPNKRLKLLHLEDEPDFSDLVRSLLLKEGFQADFKLVTTRAEFEQALAQGVYDAVLADNSLPDYSGVEALKFLRVNHPATPFLLVSGAIGEEAAIAMLKSGATDYVPKLWPERLVPALQRALHEAEEHRLLRAAEAELKRREKYFRALTENSLDALTILSREGDCLFNSSSLKRLLGYEPAELAGRNALSLVHPDDLPVAMEALQVGLANPDKTIRLEVRFLDKSGNWRHLEVIGQNRLGDPDIAGIVINSRDVTDRKRAEHRDAALSKLGQQLSSAASAAEAATIIKTVSEELFRWDAFTLDLFSAEEDRIYPLLNVDTNRAGVRFEVEVSHRGGEVPSGMARRIIQNGAELRLRKEPLSMPADVRPMGDVSRPSASLALAPIRNRTKVIGILSIQSYTPKAYEQSDLNVLQTLADHCGGALERLRAEQALRESEERFRDLFAGSPDAIFVEAPDGTVLDANPAACELHGVRREELVGTNVLSLVPPHSRESVAREFADLVSGKLRQVEGLSWTKEGCAIPVEVRASRIDYAGHPAVLLHVRDITERKRAEAALRSSEMLFHSVWENSADGMRLTDAAGNIVAVNDAFCQLVGRKREELEGQPLSVILAPSEQPEKHLEQHRQRFQNHVLEQQSERQVALHDGRKLTLQATNSFVQLRGGAPLLLSLFRDVTAQKRLEDQLRQAQKMEAIGQLAGGVAHDFNNILTVIHGHASLLTLSRRGEREAASSAEQITRAAERAAALTRQLLAFSRRQVMQPRRLDLNEVVSNMTKMLGRILGEDIALQLHYSSAAVIVEADVGMLEQVLLNFAVNSRDAMPAGGRLSIRIAVRDLDGAHLARHPEARSGRFACLSVADTGCGIPPENMRRIFEPFFTTKEVGKGTGLGLATVYGIVKQHQGWIEVASEVGQGARFEVFLPCLRQPVEAPPAQVRIPVRGGHETILVVEDEAPVRELVCNLLASHGYQVLQAESGVKALELWRQANQPIHLLLTDLVMPDRMNGRELAEKLLAERPGIKVLFTSGYSADVVGKDFVLGPGFNYLQKPYHPDKLALAVRDCLDARN